MEQLRSVALSIAGLDPSAGAGLLADVKTFEAHRVYGLSIPSAITYQHDLIFKKAEWVALEKITEQIDLLQERFKINYIKIGLIENLTILDQLLAHLTASASPVIVWDPVLKASAGYNFHARIDPLLLERICKKIYLITPNIPEAIQLGPTTDAMENAKSLSRFCNVFLKGGHSETQKGKDFLLCKEGKSFSFRNRSKDAPEKHGSGCVLASSLTANLAKKVKLHRACLQAKNYTAAFLNSNKTLLGYHKL
jgi:hydroxymethylpyrimidine/phosphomethylpyrimidine kinase